MAVGDIEATCDLFVHGLGESPPYCCVPSDRRAPGAVAVVSPIPNLILTDLRPCAPKLRQESYDKCTIDASWVTGFQ
eukprot:1363125-Pyramimonas_sp.AAC.1